MRFFTGKTVHDVAFAGIEGVKDNNEQHSIFPNINSLIFQNIPIFLSSKSRFFINFHQKPARWFTKKLSSEEKFRGFFSGICPGKSRRTGREGRSEESARWICVAGGQGEEEAVNEFIAWCCEGPLVRGAG